MFKYVNSCASEEQLFEIISPYDILTSYLDVSELPILINAPYRKDEKKSLVLFNSVQNGTVMYKDFATGDCGDILRLLSKIWICTRKDVIDRIWRDLNSNNTTRIKLLSKNHTRIKTSTSNVKVQIRDWENFDLEFWGKYGISLDWLKFGDVYPISYIVIERDNGQVVNIKADKYAYVYVEKKDNVVTLKVYQPYSQTMKWLSKHNASVIDLWTKLPEHGDKLIITSSRKDALCTWENTGIPSISLQGEGFIPKESIINELKSRFNDIYVLFDNDFNAEENHGQIFADKLCQMYGLKKLTLPTELKEKDQSDIVKHYGREKLRSVIATLLSN